MEDTELRNRITSARAAVAAAAAAAGRDPSSVSILPVTKGFPAEVVRRIASEGFGTVGENRVGEAEQKRSLLGDLDIRYQMVGHLQRNKAATAVRTFDRIDSVDSLRLARRIDAVAGRTGKTPFPVLVQVNASGEESKSGLRVSTAAPDVGEICMLPNVEVQGLMTMAPFEAAPEELRAVFRRTRTCLEECRRRFPDRIGAELSMGMSGDFEIAIAEGATQIRLGTFLLGERGRG